jgi:hypothetical protein
MILATETGQEVYLVRPPSTPLAHELTLEAQIDRKEDWYRNWNLTFPHQDGPEFNHSNTVLDGELVIDVDPVTGNVRSVPLRP